MNILDITNEDIARLQRGIKSDEMTARDREIIELIGCDSIDSKTVRYLRLDYTLPAPTEVDVIKYLQASEVPPSQWHPAAQEWALSHKNDKIWEVQLERGGWASTSLVNKKDNSFWSFIIRLRADYVATKDMTEAEIIAYLQASEVPPAQWHPAAQEWARRHENEPIWEYTDIVYSDTDKDNKQSMCSTHKFRLRADYGKAKEPEMCVWKYNGIVGYHFSQCAHNYYDPSMNHKRFEFCPYCGKRIEVKNDC